MTVSKATGTVEDLPEVVAALKKTSCDLAATNRKIPLFAFIGGLVGAGTMALIMWLLQCGCFAVTK